MSMTVAGMLMARGRLAVPLVMPPRTIAASAAAAHARGINADVLGPASGPVDRARAESALHAIKIPADGFDYETWLAISLAANAAGVPVKVFAEWAERCAKYNGDPTLLKAFNCYDPAPRVR